jgi:ABC-type sugar transport system permease subunit
VTSLSVGIRAGILNKPGADFQLDKTQLSSITATAFRGFSLAVIIDGIIVDNSFAGQKVLHATLVIPLVLLMVFTGLVFYMRTKNKTQPLQEVAV